MAYTKDFYKAQSAYLDACNTEFLAWQSYNTLSEKTTGYYGEDDTFYSVDITDDMRSKLQEVEKAYKLAKILVQEAKKKYQDCGAVI